jgi:hypothetical protein
MLRDEIHARQRLTAERVRRLTQSVTRLQALRDQAAQDLETRTKEIEVLTSRLDVLAKVGELFRALMDRLVLDQMRSVESVVTDGLKTIFYDKKLSFESDVTQRNNRICIDFFIKQAGAPDSLPIRGSPVESFGGGPVSVSSLTLRILALLRLKRWPMLLLDETLFPVSDQYIDPTGQFLAKLSESTKIPILLITHKTEYVTYATTAYQATDRVDPDETRWLHLKRLRGAT